MSRRLRDTIRFRVVGPANYTWDQFVLRLRNLVYPGPVVKTLVISDNASWTSEEQFRPLYDYRTTLRDRCGIVFKHVPVEDALSMSENRISGYSLIILKMVFTTPPDEAVRVVKHIHDRKGPAKLVYFDGDDDACILWPQILEFVDSYVKKQMFADKAHYLTEFVGKCNLTDYVANNPDFGFDFEDNIIPRCRPVAEAHLDKIILGCNIGVGRQIGDLLDRSRQAAETIKDYDIVSRASAPKDDWLFALRGPMERVLDSMSSDFHVVPTTERVTPEEYYQELFRSKICVSPFGYGEICWRDFESVLCRCLLIKPDMSHLITEPDIFVPHETYIPVRWDFDDLEETCRYYLENEQQRLDIVDNAHRVLTDYYKCQGSVDSIQRMVESLGLHS